MRSSSWLLLAALLCAFGAAHAQRAQACPTLPAGADLTWDVQEGPDFLYCKAIRGSDAGQSFAVMLREDAMFRPSRSMREGRAVIDGHAVRWYSSEVATAPSLLIRETLLELDKDLTAHIVVRAASDTQLATIQRQVEALRFNDLRMGSN